VTIFWTTFHTVLGFLLALSFWLFVLSLIMPPIWFFYEYWLEVWQRKD